MFYFRNVIQHVLECYGEKKESEKSQSSDANDESWCPFLSFIFVFVLPVSQISRRCCTS